MNHPPLLLPPINPKIESKGDEEFIFDPIRKKQLLLTPEEWVRQHFVNLLKEHLGYPAGLFQLERQHKYAGSSKRSDILVLDKSGKPFLLVECKAYDVSLNEKTLTQISTYNKTLQAKYIAVSNGLKHFVWKFENGKYDQLTSFPSYTG